MLDTKVPQKGCLDLQDQHPTAATNMKRKSLETCIQNVAVDSSAAVLRAEVCHAAC